MDEQGKRTEDNLNESDLLPELTPLNPPCVQLIDSTKSDTLHASVVSRPKNMQSNEHCGGLTTS